MDSIIDLIDEIQDLLDSCKKQTFSASKIIVDKEEITELLQDIRLNIPSEIAQAKRISEKCEKIVQEAHNKANQIIKQAEDQAEKLVMEHEITRQAKAEADAIVEDARQDAIEMRRNAISYADGLLSDVENALSKSMSKVEDESRAALDTIKEVTDSLSDFMDDELNIIVGNRDQLRGDV
ncbi:MAG: hypothetical protein LUG66_00200 [Clostridiales bacterium]|nr:hypothetical protein [Clostridiales bacterium]